MTLLSTLRTIFRRPQPVTCADAGRLGNLVRHEKERAKIRAKTIALAEQIGKPELAEPLKGAVE
ncbi:hypothetical protein [Sphingopyxis macrogoltabida]|uniref:Uncharacterized protein n=1 Tax=Sphingopyxis macrogoltabida TaxID=33050 RepID=A0AAC8Z131_SPHMC|nr:hypothetical protein [Sphingopyxis macrogoltabida]ALJ12613.1 hypothetical protein LH19_07015 [Sphingopyxis macrogoltabida]AMU89916.1 hypothetical protein ATM17_12805 [Sphingopyxis macrogoltabida]